MLKDIAEISVTTHTHDSTNITQIYEIAVLITFWRKVRLKISSLLIDEDHRSISFREFVSEFTITRKVV